MQETPLGLIRFLRLDQIPLALLTIGLAWLAVHLLTRFFDDFGERFTKRRIFLKQFAAMSRFVIFLLTLFFATLIYSFIGSVLGMLILAPLAAIRFKALQKPSPSDAQN